MNLESSQLTYNHLKKLAKRASGDAPSGFRIAVVGDSSTQYLSTAIRGYGIMAGMPVAVMDADYNQIDAQLMDPASETYEFKPDMLLLYLSAEWMWHRFCLCPQEKRQMFAEQELNYIQSCWNRFHEKMPAARILQTNFVQVPDGVFGNSSALIQTSFLYQVRKLNYLLAEAASNVKAVSLLDLDIIQSTYGRNYTHDCKMKMVAKAMLSLDILPVVAKQVIDIICATKGQIKKCVVLDLDNTLWGGVIGDDGLEGIQLGELGSGAAFFYLQRWLKELKERGMILAVCSKNNEDTAKTPFQQHPDMILRLEDISVFVANWEDKASNIRKIQQILNIGMDSIVFLDDNPFERNAVRSQIADITVPELPEDPAEYLPYLQSLNLFETISFSAEDRIRTLQYQQESIRQSSQSNFADYEAYLQSLDMRASCGPFDSFHTPRIAQLTQRSNQFNLRTIRYTEDDIARLREQKDVFTCWFELKDKYGDYGLISVLIMRREDEDTLFIDTLLMSCRVLKRGMEQFVINKIASIAKAAGCRRVIGEYIPTAKNAMVRDLYPKMGFDTIDETHYVMNTDQFTPHSIYIEEE